MKKKIYAVLLAGGKGTRLWPLSTGKYSKSFVRIGKEKPLITEAIKRLRGLVGKKHIIIVVDKAQAPLLKNFARGIPKRNILVEPFGRSTASAVGLAAIELKPDDIMVVLPTDSLIKEGASFRKTIKDAVNFALEKEKALICIGIRPKEASTAYGYIKVGLHQKKSVYAIDKFIEKPPKTLARRMAKGKGYFWNAGIFVFRAKSILGAVKKHAPQLLRQLERIRKNKNNKRNAYLRMKNVSIDYQIMEKAKNLYCAAGKFSWRDLGNWRSLEELFKKDKRGNICFGKATLMDTRNCIIYNSEKNKLGTVGLKDIVVVNTENGTLVCRKEDAERVKVLNDKNTGP
ncbi:MAG: sugar phosphate nucleotidyltransferase [Candidatus Omnitrophota bacterium]